jgi:hypothetical protein
MSNFRTQVNFSSQIKEYPNTDGTLSGSVNVQQYTILGTDYLDLPLGLDNTSTGITATYGPITIINGTFTGTTGSTTFYFSDSNMDIAGPYLSAITASNSGLTQYVDAFSVTNTVIVDGNSFDIYYSGVSFDMTPTNLDEYSPGEFSGITFTNVLNYLSGTTYPWWFLKSGSTTWNEVKGRTQTDRLTIIEGATTGYILTSANSNGDAVWTPNSGITWSTSACTSPFFVSYIEACPSPTDPIEITAGGVGINMTPNVTLQVSGDTIINSHYLMLADTLTTIPSIPKFRGFINVQDNVNSTGYFSRNQNVSGDSGTYLYNDSLVNCQLFVGGSQSLKPGGPIVGDAFYQNKVILKGNALSNGMVFNPSANDSSSTFWWEFNGSIGMILKGDGTNTGAYLGLALNPDGTEMPTSNLQIGGTGTTGTFQYKDGNQQDFYVLMSDTDGNANWQSLDYVLSGGCLSDVCIKGILSLIRDLYIKGLTFGTGGSDVGSTGTTYVTNTAGGKDVLFYNSTGIRNTGFGSEVLSANTIGYSNTGLGTYALKSNTTGIDNTAIGAYSLESNTINGGNTAIGSGSLQSNTIGYGNTGIGYNSIPSNIDGYVNTGLGIYALHDNVSGYENVSAGHYSLFQNTTGYQNTGIGNQSMTSNTTGYINTGVGYGALGGNTIGLGNTSIGYGSGGSNDIGNYNTFLGYGANSTPSNLVNATAVGYNAIVDQNDSMVLGNGLINVGVGISTPTSTLHLIGLSGFSQLRLETQYTPTSTLDTNGNQGDTAWDDNFIYIKTSVGWKRSGLSTF